MTLGFMRPLRTTELSQVFHQGKKLCGLLSLFAVLWAGGCGEQQAAPPPRKPAAVPVKVATVNKKEIRPTITLVGTVQPWKRSLVASEVAGLVEDFPVKEGDFVKQGDLLARLNTETLALRLDAAVASRRERDVRYRQAQRDLERSKQLVEKELVAQKEYDDALAEVSALREQLNSLDSVIRQARDRLSKASSINAPFPGWVTQEHTEVGEWVEEGGPVAEMVDISRVNLQVPFPERFIREIERGSAATAVFDGLPGFKTQGRVTSIVAQADPSTRTFPIKVEIQNPDLLIKSGMVARVTLAVGQPREVLLVPKDAIVLRGGSQFIFLVDNNLAVQKPVQPGISQDGFVEVIGDLSEGMQVVVQGNERLLPGQRVRTVS